MNQMLTATCSAESTLETRAPLGLSPTSTVCVRRLLLGCIGELDPTNLQLAQWCAELSPVLVFSSPLASPGSRCRSTAIENLVGDNWMCGLRAMEVIAEAIATETEDFPQDSQSEIQRLWNQAIVIAFAAERFDRSTGGSGNHAWLCGLLLGLGGVSKGLMLARIGATFGEGQIDVTWSDVDFLCRQFDFEHLSISRVAENLRQGAQRSAGEQDNERWLLSWQATLAVARSLSDGQVSELEQPTVAQQPLEEWLRVDAWLSSLAATQPTVEKIATTSQSNLRRLRAFASDRHTEQTNTEQKIDSLQSVRTDGDSSASHESNLPAFALRLFLRSAAELTLECQQLGEAAFCMNGPGIET